MSTTLSTPTKVSSGVWRYAWTGTAPYSVFDYSTYDFTLRDSDDTEYFASNGGTVEPQAIEVFDSTEDSTTAKGVIYPAKITLQWRDEKPCSVMTSAPNSGPSQAQPNCRWRH